MLNEAQPRGTLALTRLREHLDAWICRTRQEGCGVNTTYSSSLPGGVPVVMAGVRRRICASRVL